MLSEESDTEVDFSSISLSLPSLSVANNRIAQQMTVKEVDEKLAELRRENFNLKLRLYFVEKEKNGVTKSDLDFGKREDLLKAIQKAVAEKDEEIKQLKIAFQNEIKKKEAEIQILMSEKEDLLTDLQVNASMCRSLNEELENLKTSHHNTEKAIARQVSTVNKMLKKAKNSLQENSE